MFFSLLGHGTHVCQVQYKRTVSPTHARNVVSVATVGSINGTIPLEDPMTGNRILPNDQCQPRRSKPGVANQPADVDFDGIHNVG